MQQLHESRRALVRSHLPLVRSTARLAAVRCGVDPSEAVAEGYLVLVEIVGQSEDAANLEGLLVVAVKRRVAMMHRSAVRRSRWETPLDAVDDEPDNAAGDDPTHRHVVAQLELADVCRGLGQLTARQRTSVLMAAEGHSHKEISAHLRVSLYAAIMHLHRARRAIGGRP